MRPIDVLLGPEGRRVRGPAPAFGRAHVLHLFLTVGDGGPVGRKALAAASGLGEGSARTVLKKLGDEGLIETVPAGCRLTPAGRRIYRSVRAQLSRPELVGTSPLSIGPAQAAVAVKKGARSVVSGIEQRDAAISLGASGATTYAIRSGRFAVPGGSADCEKDFPGRGWKALRGALRPADGDAVILCGAVDEVTAKLGAEAAALTLL